MSKTNIPAGGCPVTKTEAPRQKPAAWAGKEGKV